MKKKLYIKYNEDDILEIVTEYLAKEHGFEEFNSRAQLLGTPGVDIRVVAVIGESKDDSVNDVNLNEMDLKTEYNGPHSKARYINPTKFANMKIEDC
ncbi:hypothetical protein SPSYN_03151 [Sporotomaculum syntrophicum]|uniref:Uncharacterized protein n=1 Tax=Sporotomaculum syntrophicum TaxID=182264 RepID=A0A9D2WLY6_9FIRM|nr:hypothetical protein [Sporotomaculum syntrophicum]KAF1083694.1 hypothetical protein SPSYN_03151 [Sporotomaculum syntrophicum]